MEGYDVVTNDEHKIGKAVRVSGENVIVEQGTIFKSRRPVPLAVAHVDEEASVIRLTVSKEIVDHAPECGDDLGVDERAVAEYYGITSGPEPASEGYGETTADDPGRSAEEDALRAGLDSPVQERARVRESIREEGGQPPESSPGLLGDRHG